MSLRYLYARPIGPIYIVMLPTRRESAVFDRPLARALGRLFVILRHL